MNMPPKPEARPRHVSLARYVRLFRRDILSAQPAHLYRAKMAEFRTPFFRSFLLNQPALVRQILIDRPELFPKSARISEGLRPLLGRSVFLTNGDEWARQRRIINPAFEGGRVREQFPAMQAAADGVVARLTESSPAPVEVEALMAHGAADVIFRTLFSLPIEDTLAARVFSAFQTYQRRQPILNLGAFIPLPRWVPRLIGPGARRAAADIRGAIGDLVTRRLAEIDAGTAPDDLATKIMTMTDPETGGSFDRDEMIDQVAIFFLAGHETSAAALAWALFLLASHPEVQEEAAAEADRFAADPSFAALAKLQTIRGVWREALRLYPPVPMMVRTSVQKERFRNRDIPAGAQIVVSPWHLHRHPDLWDRPDEFDPARQYPPGQFIPFSAGPRVCPGAGFAMAEGPLFLCRILAAFRLRDVPRQRPMPIAYLTVRSRDGIWLRITPRCQPEREV
ncbi:MAG: cytochrome P450 [Pseudomonadota bacterium]